MSGKKWVREKWMADVFPGKENIYSAYRHLSGRELMIVSVAVLDAALAEVITLRLKDEPNEAISFLGLNDDSRAPAVSFGARIQLALLLDIISAEDAEILRAMKAARNEFAHAVKTSYLSPKVQKALQKLYGLLKARGERMVAKNLGPAPSKEFLDLGRHLGKLEAAAEGLVLAVLTIYQAYFHRLHERVIRLERGYKGGAYVVGVN